MAERRAAVEDHLRQQRTLLEAKRPLLGRRQFPEVDAFLAAFDEPQWRRPILAIIGGRGMGKSQLAAKILTELAAKLQVPRYLEITVESDEHIDMSDFDLREHSGVLLDGVGDAPLVLISSNL